MKQYVLVSLWVLMILLQSCGKDQEKDKKINRDLRYKPKTGIVYPDKAQHVVGDSIHIEVEKKETDILIDSVQFFINSEYLHTDINSPFTFNLQTGDFHVGEHHIRTVSYYNQENQDVNRTSIILHSDIKPKTYTYRIINSYPHDPEAFTQGLVYNGQYLFEGTGQKGESSIRKLNLETGNVIQSHYISSNLFGEGITIHEDKLIQLTWKGRMGFIYDKHSFEEIDQFNYPTEGWGITTIGDKLVMSDGSATLYELETTGYTETRRFDVYGQKGPVQDLNELEYVNGLIYANVFQSNEIAMIDPHTGKLVGIINLEGLSELNEYGAEIDVLNGIAYDSANNRLFVTGKWWTNIFEIEIIETGEPLAIQ